MLGWIVGWWDRWWDVGLLEWIKIIMGQVVGGEMVR